MQAIFWFIAMKPDVRFILGHHIQCRMSEYPRYISAMLDQLPPPASPELLALLQEEKMLLESILRYNSEIRKKQNPDTVVEMKRICRRAISRLDFVYKQIRVLVPDRKIMIISD